MTEAEVQARYVRFRGRTYGPFGADELVRMVKRGQITRMHELSPDRLTWAPAGRDAVLFPQAMPAVTAAPAMVQQVIENGPSGGVALTGASTGSVKPATLAAEGNESPSAALADSNQPNRALNGPSDAPAAAIWYYAIGDHRYGPMNADALLQLYQTMVIDNLTEVWREGMTQWVPLVQSGLLPIGREAAKSVSGGVSADALQSRMGLGERQSLQVQGTIIGCFVGAVTLLFMNIPLVAEAHTIWWWDLMREGTLGLYLVFLLVSSAALCIVSFLTRGNARGIVYISIGAISVLVLGILSVRAEYGTGESLLLLVMLLTGSALRSVSQYRCYATAHTTGKVLHGIVGGLTAGIAVLLGMIALIRLVDAKPITPQVPSGIVLGAVCAFLSIITFAAAGVCGLANIRTPASRGLNQAGMWLPGIAFVLLWLGPTIMLVAVGQGVNDFATNRQWVIPPTAVGQVIFVMIRVLTIFFLPFLLISQGLVELLVATDGSLTAAHRTDSSSALDIHR